MATKSESTTKPYQIKMDERVHALLKRRAKDMGMTIGDFIQNMMSAFEHRLLKLKEENDLHNTSTADELDAKLMKLLFFQDAGRLTDGDLAYKIEKIKTEFEGRDNYRPDLTIKNGEI